MSYDKFLELVRDVESEDPIDVTGLPIPLDSYRSLICNNVWEMREKLWDPLSKEDRELAMMAAMAKLILDNFILHTRIKIAFQEE